MTLLFSSVAALLFERPPDPEELLACFPGMSAEKGPAPPSGDGTGEGDQIVLTWSAETGAQCGLDIVSTAWPDDHGLESRQGGDAAAAGLGALGPRAASGGLARAAHFTMDPQAAHAARSHTAFVRICMYGGVLQRPGKQIPPQEAELSWLVEAGARLAALPGALAWFEPDSETLLSARSLIAERKQAFEAKRLPIQALVSLRWRFSGGWLLIDTLGMARLQRPDLEFAGPGTVADFPVTGAALLNNCIYQWEKGDIFQTGNTTDGPSGRIWRAQRCAGSVNGPMRPVIRWQEDGVQAPADFRPQHPEAGPVPPSKAEEFASMLRDFRAQVERHRAGILAYTASEDGQVLTILAAEAKQERDIPAALQGATLIPVFPVIVARDESSELRPALVVGTFDPSPEANFVAFLLAGQMAKLYGADDATSPADRALQKIVQDDGYVSRRRIRIPEPAAQGHELYAFHAILRMTPASAGSGVMLLALTPPGPGPAAVVHLPQCLLHGESPPRLDLPENPPPSATGCTSTLISLAKLAGKTVLVLLVIAVISIVGRCNETPTPGSSQDILKKARELSQRVEAELKEKKRRRAAEQP